MNKNVSCPRCGNKEISYRGADPVFGSHPCAPLFSCSGCGFMFGPTAIARFSRRGDDD